MILRTEQGIHSVLSHQYGKEILISLGLKSVNLIVTSEDIHLYILYCICIIIVPPTEMFIPPIERIIIVFESCKFIEVNPPLYVGVLVPRNKW